MQTQRESRHREESEGDQSREKLGVAEMEEGAWVESVGVLMIELQREQ